MVSTCRALQMPAARMSLAYLGEDTPCVKQSRAGCAGRGGGRWYRGDDGSSVLEPRASKIEPFAAGGEEVETGFDDAESEVHECRCDSDHGPGNPVVDLQPIRSRVEAGATMPGRPQPTSPMVAKESHGRASARVARGLGGI